jgi:hypothetical protein
MPTLSAKKMASNFASSAIRVQAFSDSMLLAAPGSTSGWRQAAR